MSLRDEEFEKDFAEFMNTQPQLSRPSGERLVMRIAAVWATERERERALRIVLEEQEADYDDHRNRVKAIERRLKGDSNG